MLAKGDIIVKIPDDQLDSLKSELQKIVSTLEQIKVALSTERRVGARFITAAEFMEAVKIKRWKFDQLIASNNIHTLKKKRKVYVLATEVERYFSDPNIQ